METLKDLVPSKVYDTAVSNIMAERLKYYFKQYDSTEMSEIFKGLCAIEEPITDAEVVHAIFENVYKELTTVPVEHQVYTIEFIQGIARFAAENVKKHIWQ